MLQNLIQVDHKAGKALTNIAYSDNNSFIYFSLTNILKSLFVKHSISRNNNAELIITQQIHLLQQQSLPDHPGTNPGELVKRSLPTLPVRLLPGFDHIQAHSCNKFVYE